MHTVYNLTSRFVNQFNVLRRHKKNGPAPTRSHDFGAPGIQQIRKLHEKSD